MHSHDSGTPGQVRARGTRRRRLWAAVPLAVGTLALTAACGSSYGGTTTAASSAPASTPAATGAVLAAASTGLGTILVDGTGLTVYDFANDTGSTSTCSGGCAAIWRPVAAPDPLPASLAGVPAELGQTARTDGTEQLTVAGHPVYTYQGDDAPGQTNGNGITLNGGLWTAVSPDGSPLAANSSAPGSSAPSIGY
jgi:predicted lipoprotein with Yx(FWY)xxD motif